MQILPVILSGGAGTRLWPLSRSEFPKQLQALIGNISLLQQTAQRLPSRATILPPIVVCGESQRFLVAEQLRENNTPPTLIVLEPAPRSTAPALAIPALWVKDPLNTLLVAMPADHFIADSEAFQEAILKAAEEAERGTLMTLGVKPTRPHTGFGYIEQGPPLPGTSGAFVAKQFKEKPDEETAKTYVNAGTFLWNAGIFVFRADCYLTALSRFHPEIVTACKEALETSKNDLDFLRLGKEGFEKSPDISIDYAVMEKADNIGVLPVSFDWSDVGGWPALWQIGDKDAAGNVAIGDVLLKETTDSYIRADKRLVTTIGIQNMVVVDTSNALLVASMDKVDEVKAIVAQIKKDGRPEYKEHLRVWRPWGCYEQLNAGPRFQVKKITVKPGGKLSLQKHHHRAEHWIVVSGTAKVQREDDFQVLGPDESIYIPLGTRHRLENPGKVPLDLIEVQSGDYLGEDDIVRFDDIYSRINA